MMVYNVIIDNLVRERWEDRATPRVVTKWDAQGNVIEGYPRAYTPDENILADARVAIDDDNQMVESSRSAVRAIIDDLKPEIDRYDAVLANPAVTSIEKDLARAGKRTAKAVIDIAKLLKRY